MLEPNPVAATAAAFVLNEMPVDQVADALSKLLAAIFNGMVVQYGMSKPEAAEFASRFITRVLDDLAGMPSHGTRH